MSERNNHNQPTTTMTLIDIITRINAAIRSNDQSDLEFLAVYVADLLIEPEMKFALTNLIESASELLG